MVATRLVLLCLLLLHFAAGFKKLFGLVLVLRLSDFVRALPELLPQGSVLALLRLLGLVLALVLLRSAVLRLGAALGLMSALLELLALSLGLHCWSRLSRWKRRSATRKASTSTPWGSCWKQELYAVLGLDDEEMFRKVLEKIRQSSTRRSSWCSTSHD